MADHLSCPRIGHLPDSEAELRDNISIVKRERGLFKHSEVSRMARGNRFASDFVPCSKNGAMARGVMEWS